MCFITFFNLMLILIHNHTTLLFNQKYTKLTHIQPNKEQNDIKLFKKRHIRQKHF